MRITVCNCTLSYASVLTNHQVSPCGRSWLYSSCLCVVRCGWFWRFEWRRWRVEINYFFVAVACDWLIEEISLVWLISSEQAILLTENNKKTQKLLIDNLTNRPRKNFAREIKTKREKSTDLAATIKATQRTLKWQIWTWETFRQLSSLRTARIQLSQRRMLPKLKRSKNYWNLTRTGFTSKYSSLISCHTVTFLQKIRKIFFKKS